MHFIARLEVVTTMDIMCFPKTFVTQVVYLGLIGLQMSITLPIYDRTLYYIMLLEPSK